MRPEYSLDYLSQVLVHTARSTPVRTLRSDLTVAEARDWVSSPDCGGHNGFPVVARGEIVGVVTRRDLFAAGVELTAPVRSVARRSPIIAFPHSTLREAADHMVRENVGRLPVLDRTTGRLKGIITRSDLLSAHARRLQAEAERARGIREVDRR